MKDTKLVSFSIFLLALAIAFGSYWIGIKLESKPVMIEQEHPLMTLQEVADYLRLPSSLLEQIILQQTKQRGSTFNTYDYIPFTVINGSKYFIKTEINKWIAQSNYKVVYP